MKIIAHRGDSAAHPENTPQGWNAAFAAGAFAIEADIRFSSDGVGICAHDPDLGRLFGVAELASDLTSERLAQLTNGDGARVSLLAEVLAHAGEGRRVLLDLKDETPQGLERLWAAIEAGVDPQHRHLVLAGCHTLAAVRFFAARGEVGILGFTLDPDAGPDFRRAGARIIRLWESDVTAERVQQLHDLDAEIWVTTGGRGTDRAVGDTTRQTLAGLAEAGVAGVLVNDTNFARTTLEAME